MLKKEVEEPVLVGHVLDLSRIGSILSLSSSSNWLDRLVRSVQNPAQGQELLLRHVPLLQRRHEDVHPRRWSITTRFLSFHSGYLES